MFDSLCQFPFDVDGYHIPIKFPADGLEVKKEYHSNKNFHSIVLMTMVDFQYRFMCASCGYSGNSHDVIIFHSVNLYQELTENSIIPLIGQNENGVEIQLLVLGDSAFLFSNWPMKPYANAVLSKKQGYFNYRQRRTQMIVETAYGQMKGRWRLLMQKKLSHSLYCSA